MAERGVAVEHFYHDQQQQQEAHTLGMWIFLATEVMFFGGLFMGYAAYLFSYPEAFTLASHELDIVLSSINTVVLLASSLMIALGVRSAQTDDRRGLVMYLLATLGLGLVFLGIKIYEYYEKFTHHLFPGPNFMLEGAPQEAELFFGLYFATTGLHAIHMIIGMVLLGFFAFWAWRGWFSSTRYTAVENMGLYWHFVDVAWVFIFPLFYLIEPVIH